MRRCDSHWLWPVGLAPMLRQSEVVAVAQERQVKALRVRMAQEAGFRLETSSAERLDDWRARKSCQKRSMKSGQFSAREKLELAVRWTCCSIKRQSPR